MDFTFVRIAAIIAVCVSSQCIHAQSIGKVTKLEEYGVQTNIGQQRTIMAGSRASIRVLDRLIRRYPKLSYYKVNWKLKSKVPILFESTYDRSHRNVSREVYGGLKWERFQCGIDEATQRDLQVVARKNGSFSDIETRVLNRK